MFSSNLQLHMWLLLIFLLTNSSVAKKFGGFGGRSHGGSHTYPQSTGFSGTALHPHHTYPQATGYSGNNHVPKQTVTHQYNIQSHTVHNHYHNHHYNPPQHVSYGATSYPVYHASPPVYVYEYRNSGSRFDNLLTGLALYNLGRMSANHNHYDSRRDYVGRSSEICKLGISRRNGDYEESRIDCKLISSFIWDTELQVNTDRQVVPKNTISTTTVNVTQVRTDDKLNSSSSVTTVTETKVVDAVNAKGESIHVTPEMICYMIRISEHQSSFKREIKCGVLQAYAQKSWYVNRSQFVSSQFSLVLIYQMLIQIM